MLQPEAVGEAAPGQSGARILDLTELLQRSLRKNGAPLNTLATDKSARKSATAKVAKVPAKKPAKTTVRKTPLRRAA